MMSVNLSCIFLNILYKIFFNAVQTTRTPTWEEGTTTTVPTTQTGLKYNVRLVGWRERSARRTDLFIFHALIVKMINIFKQSVIFYGI